MAEEAKAAFSSGDFTTAIQHFTEAINLSPTNHVLYSNRSAAHTSLHQYSEALTDAKRTVELKPDWPKGYSRVGAAHLGLNQSHEAVLAYTKGLEIDPSYEALKSGLANAKKAVSRSRPSGTTNPFGDVFQGPEMWAKLTADPSTKVFLQQPDYVNMMKEIQRNWSNLDLYLQDQRVIQSLGVLSNVRLPGGDDENDEKVEAPEEKKEISCPFNLKLTMPEVVMKEPEPEPELTEKENAQKANEFMNEKKYPDAIKHYTETIKRNPKDLKAYSNRAECYCRLGALPEGLKDAEKCIELDPTFSEGYSRKAAVEISLKEYNTAMETYQEGLKHDPQNKKLLDGVRKCVEQIIKANRGGLTPEEWKERQAKRMQDPEIQNILKDPDMRQLLSDLQEDPNLKWTEIQNPEIKIKIQTLISAGIVQRK